MEEKSVAEVRLNAFPVAVAVIFILDVVQVDTVERTALEGDDFVPFRVVILIFVVRAAIVLVVVDVVAEVTAVKFAKADTSELVETGNNEPVIGLTVGAGVGLTALVIAPAAAKNHHQSIH